MCHGTDSGGGIAHFDELPPRAELFDNGNTTLGLSAEVTLTAGEETIATLR